jgi:uncharacterized protein (TIGR02246 family)
MVLGRGFIAREDMMRRIALFATAAAITLVSGLASPRVAADEPMLPSEAFHATVEKLVAAQNKGDAAAEAALYTDDAILLPADGTGPVWGADNIRKFSSQAVKSKSNRKIASNGILLGGPESAIETGTWTGDLPAQNGAPAAHVEGTYLVVGILVDGQWKVWANSWQMKPDIGAVGSSMPTQADKPSK